ncbi:hypothetical protein SAMN05216188_11774 [Lentzea xinjiangensis]|uniref:Uncharacterized protein n=1 Tax=Lentzea xinjiangensis TaxID=402600 RepID=A0A1H9T047_9PSEU|nr:hypothetical protein SAMN05216188_11774 [Lentzea xinjiangensis]
MDGLTPGVDGRPPGPPGVVAAEGLTGVPPGAFAGPPGLSDTFTDGPEGAGVLVEPLPAELPGDGGTEARFPEEDEDDEVPAVELLDEA